MSIETIPLGEVASVFNGKTPSKLEQRSQGHPVLKIKDVDENGNFRGNFESYVDPSFAEKQHKKIIIEGDVLVLNAAHNADYVGSKLYRATAEVKGSIPTGEWLLARSTGNSLFQGYLWHWLRSPATRFQIRHIVKGIHLYPRDVSRLMLPLPPLKEQRRIAAILDNADAIRRKRQQALTLADEFLKSVFLDMFGDPVTNPKAWDRSPFLEIAKIDTNMVSPKEEPYIDMKHVGPEYIEKQTGAIGEVPTAREENLISGKYLFDANHILYTKIRPYLQKVSLPDFVGICSADIYPIRAVQKRSTLEFLWSILISDAYVHYYNHLPDRANIPKINMKEMNAYLCIDPPYPLQQKYSEVFEEMDKSKGKLQSALNEANNLFASLSQCAFRGEL